MSLSPFEIRLELLKMAKDMLENDYFTRKEIAHNAWEATRDSQTGKLEGKPVYTSYPTEQEIIKKAEALNAFISKTSN